MPKSRIPSYRLHKSTGQAVVVLQGRSVYLGKFDSPDSHDKYDQVIAEYLAERAKKPSPHAPPAQNAGGHPGPQQVLLVSELVLRYWGFARNYYVKNGRPTGELDPLRQALRLLRRHCGGQPVAAVGPLAIKDIQAAMVRQPLTRRVKVLGPDGTATFVTKVIRVGLSRRTINKQVGRIKRVFRWAVAEQLLDPTVYAAIREAPGLKKHRSGAREKPRVRAVRADHFEAALKHVPPVVAAMARVQWLCGCRPQEVVLMRAGDIDRSGPVWEYRPRVYKTEHVNEGDDESLERVVYLGPQAQAELTPLLAPSRGSYLFRPGRPPRQQSRTADGPDSPVKPAAPRKHYTVAGYRQELQRGCSRAGVPVWSPNQLRHAAATRIRKELGLDKAQVVLGHRKLDVTQVYADINREAARAAMERLG